MFKNIIILMSVCFIFAACSGTVKSPITGITYNVNVGCNEDNATYEKDREEAIRKSDPDIKTVDCPKISKEDKPY